MQTTTAPKGLRNASSRWKDLRITHVIRPVQELQSHAMSKEALRVSGNRANSCVFYKTRSKDLAFATWRERSDVNGWKTDFGEYASLLDVTTPQPEAHNGPA
jgi:hypothetical protein